MDIRPDMEARQCWRHVRRSAGFGSLDGRKKPGYFIRSFEPMMFGKAEGSTVFQF
jgi:hypothetical protein